MDEVSRRLRPFLAEVWEDRDGLVARVGAEVTARIPSYATTPSAEVWTGMTRIFERVVTGDPFAPPTEEDRQAAAGTGIQGARAGISGEDLAAAILLGAREVEHEVMERAGRAGVPDRVRLEGTRRAREWAEQVAVAGMHALANSPGGHGKDRNVTDALLAALRARADRSEVADLLAALGLDPGGEHVVAVARAPRYAAGLDDVDAARLRFAHTPRAAWARDDATLVGVLLEPPTPVGRLVLGVSDPAPAAGLSVALVDAERACRAAVALAGPGRHSLDTLGLLVPLHEDARLRERLAARWLDPLDAEPRHDLHATLRLWQRHGQVEVVARVLAVHANTVRNRLARIDRLVPGWRAPQAQAEVWAALVGSDSEEVGNL